MIRHIELDDFIVRTNIRHRKICFGGNRRLKIYGLLNCASGMRMRKENRVFFATEKEALLNGYRPCGHCMRAAYKKWKDGII